jgi:hypothetical protein
MKVYLPTNSFSFFKVWFGSLLLFLAILFPLSTIFLATLFVIGRTHAIGAWIAMWRAKKLNWFYVFYVFVISVAASYVGIMLLSLEALRFVAFLLFAFHFFFDEFDLQEEKRVGINILQSVTPFILVILYLVFDFLSLTINFYHFLTIALLFLAIEIMYVKEITWFFVHTKIITIFILVCIFLKMETSPVLSIFLMFHYIFWFIYPVYKLHKYKREERDGLIFALILITIPIAYTSFSDVAFYSLAGEVSQKTFFIGTVVHILCTAPFAYLFGLQKAPNYEMVKA